MEILVIFGGTGEHEGGITFRGGGGGVTIAPLRGPYLITKHFACQPIEPQINNISVNYYVFLSPSDIFTVFLFLFHNWKFN